MNHLDDDALSAYTLDGSASPEVEAHVGECEICRDGLAVFREIDGALRGRETWTTVDQTRGETSRLQEVLAYRRRLETEEREARTFLAKVIDSPLKFRNAAIAKKPPLQTEGMVRVLCVEANARHEQRPKFSREIAAAAFEIAAQLTGAGSRGQRSLMGMALREQASALRYLGSFKDALRLLEYAEKLFKSTPEADPFDVAIVNLIRATVMMKSDRLDEGVPLARQAASTFREYGDISRELAAVMVEACCDLLAGRAYAAAQSFERAIGIGRAANDTPMLARALNNCATALMDLQDLDRAERYYIEAVALYDELGLSTEKTRVEWSLAVILLSRGLDEEAARRLTRVRNELGQLGLTNDAALATLHWAEACLAIGRAAGVVDACRKIVVVFENEGMQRHARHALAVLNEALATGRATTSLIRDVRLYLERLPSHPTEAFVSSYPV